MRSLAGFVAVVAMVSVSLAKDEMQVADLVKRNLNSVGTEQARAAVKNRAVEGTLQFRVLNTNSSGTQDGKQVLVSEGNKIVSLLKLPNPSYHGERFVCDGKNLSIAYINPGNYSSFGAFVRAHSEIVTEGLWGGTLSTAWALANGDRHAKLQDTGLKKVDGKELHQLRYSPKGSDLEILLYFEPDTGRHVMTSYSLTISPQMGVSELANAKQQPTHYLLEERFADFKQSDGLWLPGRWTVQYTADVPEDPNHPALLRAQTVVSEYAVTVSSISQNVQLDPKNFEVK